MMRKIHRWVSFPLIVFVLAVTITGVWLQWDEMDHSIGVPEKPAPTATLPDDEAMQATLAKALALSAEQDANFPSQKIELNFTRDEPVAIISTSDRLGPQMTINLVTEEITQIDRPKRTLRTYFILLHSGKYFGAPGLILIFAASIVLLVLSITGIILYINMYRRRASQGRKGLFW